MTAAAEIYLDYNASAPLRPEAREACLAAMTSGANASSVHGRGRGARRIIENGRRAIASTYGFDARSLIFCASATEAANHLLTPHWSMGRQPLDISGLAVLDSDHPCLREGGRFAPDDVVGISVNRDGIVDLDGLDRFLEPYRRSDRIAMVACHAANSETGVLQPIDEIGRRVRAAGGIFVVDAVQWAGRLPMDEIAGVADYVIVSSHKLGGPLGAAAILCRGDTMMPAPLLRGGGQERGHRAGTENVAAIAGFAAAVQASETERPVLAELAALRDAFERKLEGAFGDIVFHGSGAQRLPQTSFFTIPGIDAQTAQIRLDLAGIAVSAGSACSSGKVGPSHVLQAMGADSDDGALRVSFGVGTKADHLDSVVAVLEEIGQRGRHETKAA